MMLYCALRLNEADPIRTYNVPRILNNQYDNTIIHPQTQP